MFIYLGDWAPEQFRYIQWKLLRQERITGEWILQHDDPEQPGKGLIIAVNPAANIIRIMN